MLAGMQPLPSSSAKPVRRRRMPTLPRCGCLPSFCTFFVSGIVLVPAAVFAIGAVFAAMLYAIECSDAKDIHGENMSTWTEEQLHLCSFYEWWLYIIGNLVGVSVADVDVTSGHVLSAVLDLLISVWSLTIAGLVIGLVGSLAWVSMLTTGADDALTNRFNHVMNLARATRELVGTNGGSIDFATFEALCREKGLSPSTERLRTIFSDADANESGTIDSTEVEQLIASIQGLHDSAPTTIEDLGVRMERLEAKMDRMVETMEKLVVPVRE